MNLSGKAKNEIMFIIFKISKMCWSYIGIYIILLLQFIDTDLNCFDWSYQLCYVFHDL